MNDGVGVFGTCTHADDAAVMCQERKYTRFRISYEIYHLFPSVINVVVVVI